MKLSKATLLILTAVVGLAVACGATTKLTAVWKDPAAGTTRFKKIIVAVQTKNMAMRRSAESHLVTRIPNSTASYEVLTEDETRDVNRAKAKVMGAGFDGAVVVRYLGKDTQTTYVPGTTWWGPAPYGSAWGYWGYGWGAVYDPGYIATDTIITLETHVYSLTDDKLLWASQSETTNPSSMENLINSLIDKTVAEMKKQKVL
ncbi:MAG TPA: hypothetical protein VLT86_15825 [Vicinamibacterales bacterium]|nr:hypothetical protein [Vicinamibacterales bacterium]